VMSTSLHTVVDSSVDLSIAIVSYNTKEILLDCLSSVQAHPTTIAYEVIVVDNDSRDGTVAALKEAYPAMRIVANPDNRGFAKAVNQALAVSRGRHVLLLNSDTIVKDQALATMVAYLDDHPDVGAVSCKQWTGDGHLNQTCFPFPSIRDHLFYSALFQRIAPTMQAAAAAKNSLCTLKTSICVGACANRGIACVMSLRLKSFTSLAAAAGAIVNACSSCGSSVASVISRNIFLRSSAGS